MKTKIVLLIEKSDWVLKESLISKIKNYLNEKTLSIKASFPYVMATGGCKLLDVCEETRLQNVIAVMSPATLASFCADIDKLGTGADNDALAAYEMAMVALKNNVGEDESTSFAIAWDYYKTLLFVNSS